MANRRMFSLRVVNSARFLKMQPSSQALYFHLNLHADDDGIVEAWGVIRSTGFVEGDLQILVAKEFVKILNEDLVTYITDWREHNLIRADRKIDSMYRGLLLKLVPDVEIIEPKVRADIAKYRENRIKTTECSPLDVHRTAQVRLGKDRLVNTDVETQRVFDLFISLFNRNENSYKLTGKRKLKIKCRLKDAGLKMLEEAIRRTSESKFHNGDNDRGWKADLDFIVRSYEQVERLSQLEPPAWEVQSKKADQFINEIGAQ